MGKKTKSKVSEIFFRPLYFIMHTVLGLKNEKKNQIDGKILDYVCDLGFVSEQYRVTRKSFSLVMEYSLYSQKVFHIVVIPMKVTLFAWYKSP